MIQKLCTLVLLGIFVACEFEEGSSRDTEILSQAGKIHRDITDLEQNTGQLLEQLSKNLSPKTYLNDSLKRIKSDFQAWQANLIEVPGHEQAHNHHHHSHGDSPEVTAKEMLEIQKMLHQEITKINQRLKSIQKQAISQ